MKIVAIVQARMGSTRLPGKVMKDICGFPLIEILIKRLQTSCELSDIILATSEAPENEVLCKHAASLGVKVFQGSEKNVLRRYLDAAIRHQADIIVRITGDCPLIDVDILDKMCQKFVTKNHDYFSNGIVPTFPDGLDVEIFTLQALRISAKKDSSDYNLEHVTPFIAGWDQFKVSNYTIEEYGLSGDLSDFRLTVDEKTDLENIRIIFEHFKPNIQFSFVQAIQFLKSRNDLLENIISKNRNEGAKMGTGQKLWKRAKNVIPGGNMLLSKRPEMFLPKKWPTYFSKAEGCQIWDLDNKPYYDMSIMGVGTNILGYGNSEVDAAVVDAVKSGNMSTLNCPEEVWLAEKLIELHPWAEMVRFARSGGEANAIAIRIARAAANKDKIAVCGYHGWHDWYLAVNLGQPAGLDEHLLPGLAPNGVPKNLENSVLPFRYNDFEGLLDLVNNHDIGVIKMEVQRSETPNAGFLEKVRALASSRGIVLIFDECTSGFRETFGGLHKKYGVEPDLAMFGKALGNGYAITAIIGRSSVMESAQNTFISSAFWTEKIGPTAALKTLEVMERENTWEKITETGRFIKERWQKLAELNDLKIKLSGIDALPAFNIRSDDQLQYKTLISQEMLEKGYLAGNSIYVSTAHSHDVLELYFDSCLKFLA